MKNKFTCSIIFIALLIAFTSVAVAADVDSGDTAGVVSASVAANDVAQTVDVPVSVSDNSNENKIIKNTQSDVKTENRPSPEIHNLNDSNFDEIITSTGLNGVNDGDVLNLTCDITRSNNSYLIDKAVSFEGNVKTEGNGVVSQYSVYSENDLTIYENGTAVILLGSSNAVTGILVYGAGNGFDTKIQESSVEVTDVVLYFESLAGIAYTPSDLTEFKFSLTNQQNINLKMICNSSFIIKYGLRISGNWKSVTYENFKFTATFTEDGKIGASALALIGDNITLRNSTFTFTPAERPSTYSDYGAPTRVNGGAYVIGNNILIEDCIFNIEIYQLKWNAAGTKNYTQFGIVVHNSNNVTFNNNELVFTSVDKDSSIDPWTWYGPIIYSPTSLNNLIFTNNQITARYVPGILLTTSNSIFENNTITVQHADKTIELTGDNNIVRYNTLTSKSGEGDSTVVVTGENNVVEQNPYVEPSAANYTFKLYSGQYVGAEYNGTLYNNGTLIINITSLNTNYQYDTLKINSQELFTEVKNMVLYIKYSSTMLPKDFGFKLKFDGIDKNNVDLTYIFDNDQYSAKMFDFMLEFKSDFKSTTFENFNLLIRNEINDDEPVYVGIKVNSNVILRNCNIEINLPDSFDEKVIDLSENTLIENCTFTYDVPLIFYFDDSHTDYWEEDGLVFTSTGQGNTTINNNVFIINSFEKSHDFEAVEYAFGIVVSGENFIFTNNEVNVRYVRPILITSSNAIIENNTIASMDTDYTINITGDNNIVRYNTLTAGENEGDATVITTGTGNIVRDNPYVEVVDPVLKVDTVEFVAGSTSNIQASIYLGDDVASDVNKGKVTFKVNGKTLKDANGKTIYAKVTGGVAVIDDYLIPESWAKDAVTIEAVYSGSADIAKLSSGKVNLTVTSAQAEEPSITTSDVSAAAGETITLSATITDNGKVINSGKVVFKINGKTVKNADGKVIYAKVVNNQVSFEYTLPESMKAKEYNITAVYTGNDYRLEDTKTLTVN